MSYLIFIILILLALVILVIIYYNKMVSKKNYMQEAWSGIDVLLKKRFDLIPSLVEVVKAYAKHEDQLFEKLAKQRSSVMQSKSTDDRINSEKQLGASVSKLLAVVENYPDLKANTNYLHLQEALKDVENNIEQARRYYNGTVRDNNILVETFPSNIVAGMFNFNKGVFFQVDEGDTVVPSIAF